MNEFIGFEGFSEFLTGGEQRWKVMEDMASALVRGKEIESNVDPIQRMSIEELVPIAHLNLSEILERVLGSNTASVKLIPTTRENLARDTLKSYRPFFEGLEESYSEELAGMAPLMNVFLIATGIGNLSIEALSSYEVLVPRSKSPDIESDFMDSGSLDLEIQSSNEVYLVPHNIESFIKEWSLKGEDFWMWVCLSEISKHAVISLPHIHNQLNLMIRDFTNSFEPASGDTLEKLAEQLSISGESFQNIAEMESRIMGLISNEPELLIGAQVSEEQESISEHLSTLVAVVRGVSQHILNLGVAKVFGGQFDSGYIKESIVRRELTPSPAVNLVSRLLGIDMSSNLKNMGVNFVSTITESSSSNGLHQSTKPPLARLMESPESLPTPEELGAPDLWMHRMSL